ncbi:MAG: hypothetical protein WA655_18825 [Candidatus Korobacteraceae bacterium]
MLTFAIFPVVLFFLGAVLVTGLPVALSLQNYYRSRGRESVTCPDNGQPADVEQDAKFAFWAALRGQEHSRLKSCSRWPEKGDCGQECLAQVEPSPENVERLLTKWYEGKRCAICTRALTPSDWRRSRLAVLNEQHKLFELRHMQLDQLQASLEHMRPLCWNCHQEERARQAVAPRILRGDRHGLSPAAAD